MNALTEEHINHPAGHIPQIHITVVLINRSTLLHIFFLSNHRSKPHSASKHVFWRLKLHLLVIQYDKDPGPVIKRKVPTDKFLINCTAILATFPLPLKAAVHCVQCVRSLASHMCETPGAKTDLHTTAWSVVTT